MARTIAEIETALDSSITTAISNPSGSSFAEWKLWRSIFARAVWVFENIMDVFKAEIETTVQTKQPGSFEWYNEKILEFQGANDQSGNFQGDNLVIVNGVIKYETPDTTRQIIKKASLRADSGTLAVKVAKKLTEQTLQPLTASEQIAFGIYLNNIKYPGTQTNVISKVADVVNFSIIIYYDPIYTEATVDANILAKMEEYRNSLGFDDRVWRQKIVDKMMEATGVVSVKVNTMTGKNDTINGGATVSIDPVYTLESGYFNWDPARVLTYTKYNTL